MKLATGAKRAFLIRKKMSMQMKNQEEVLRKRKLVLCFHFRISVFLCLV
jgi:hypothetical protein